MKTVISNVRLIDGTGRAARDGMTVAIEGGRFTRITPSKVSIAQAQRIDGTGKALIPGLIDAHKHIMNNGGDHMAVGLTPRGVFDNLATMLRGGVTTILDLGSADIIHVLRHASVVRPRIHTAISIVTNPGGYPAEYMPRRFYRMGAVRECQSPAQIRRTVRRLARVGVSAIKTAVVSRTFDGKPVRGWSDAQLNALTDEAHRHGLMVCAHLTYAADYVQAARCGVDSVHHAAFDGVITDRVADELIEAGVVFVPTLSLASLLIDGMQYRWCDDPQFTAGLPPALVRNMREFTTHYEQCPPDEPVPGFFVSLPKREWEAVPENQLRNVAKYIERGGTIALGTDSALGFSLHGTPVREMELMVEAGLNTVEAIQAAGQNAARVFSHKENIGTITPGALADCLLVPAEITASMTHLADISTVIQGGKVIR